MQQIEVDDVQNAWEQARLAPLWLSPTAHKPVPPPLTGHQWSWETLRPLAELAFQETSPAAVERRVLQMISPHAASLTDEFTVGNILAAIQCLLPGETARPHRHTMNALRFMLEGEGVITRVDGKDCPMAYGDLILTPGWCWHEHHHGGDAPVLWLDVLDVPLHLYMGTVKFQPGPITEPPHTLPDALFSVPNVLPLGVVHECDHSPMLRYPYADVVAALEHAPKGADGTRRVRYANPLNGGPAMPILDCSMVEFDRGEATRPVRSTANALVCVVEGQGRTTIGDDVFTWGPRDIIAIPQNNWVSHQAESDSARMFVVSDSDALQRLGLLCEEIQSDS